MQEPVVIIPRRPIRRQIHISGIDMLNVCGIQYEYVYVKGERRPPGVFRLVGLSTHRTIHYDLKVKMATGELATDIKDVAATHFEAALRETPVEPTPEDIEEGLTLKGAKDKAIALAFLHHSDLAPKLRPTAVERPFSLKLDDYLKHKAREFHEAKRGASGYLKQWYASMATAHNVIGRDGADFVGTQDIKEVYPSLFGDPGLGDLTQVVRDTKTSVKSPAKDVADHSLQLAAYSLASFTLDCDKCGHEHPHNVCDTCGCDQFAGKLPDLGVLDYLVQTPAQQKRYIRSVQTKPKQSDINCFLERLDNWVLAEHAGIFVPAKTDDWRCSERWCGFWGVCRYAKRPTTSKPLSKLVQIT